MIALSPSVASSAGAAALSDTEALRLRRERSEYRMCCRSDDSGGCGVSDPSGAGSTGVVGAERSEGVTVVVGTGVVAGVGGTGVSSSGSGW